MGIKHDTVAKVRGDELSNHYEKVEFDCCGHPALESERPRCTSCGYWWYEELDEAVNRPPHTETDRVRL